MKLLLLFLILVNAVFFAWSRWVDVSPEGVAVATPEPQAEQLVLYDEKYPPQDVEPKSAEAAPADTVVALNEPLPDESVAETTSAAPAAALVKAPVEDADTDAGQPPATPVEQAREAVDAVAERPTETRIAVLVREDGPATARCLTIGPFRELSVASTVATALRGSGLAPQAREEDAQVWVGHWVHLPPAGSRAAAIEVVEKLRQDGVSDIYIEGAGPMRHAISLGLFSDVSRAETRAGKIRTLGVRPQIRDRYREGVQHWVDVDLAPGQQLDAQSFADLPDENAALAERPCDDYTTPPTPE